MSDMRDRLQRIERGLDDPRVDVLELVNWVYSEQQAHHEAGRGVFGPGGSVDSVVRLSSFSVLGVSVDRLGYNMGELHPVAEVVHGIVCGLQREVPTKLIQHYAASASVPPGYDLEVELGPVWKGEPKYDMRGLPRPGSFKVEHDGSNAKVPVCCPLDYSHGANYQAELRREYEHWHLALRHLVIACGKSRELGRLVVTGPTIAREPWRDRGEVDLVRPSRERERAPTRHARDVVQEMVLGVLHVAARVGLVKDEGGAWREKGDGEGLQVGEELVNRLVKQGLAVYSVTRLLGPVELEVTPKGHEELKAARLVA